MSAFDGRCLYRPSNCAKYRERQRLRGVAAFATFEACAQMNALHRRAQHLVPFKIPIKVWVALALAIGVFTALLMVLAFIGG